MTRGRRPTPHPRINRPGAKPHALRLRHTAGAASRLSPPHSETANTTFTQRNAHDRATNFESGVLRLSRKILVRVTDTTIALDEKQIGRIKLEY